MEQRLKIKFSDIMSASSDPEFPYAHLVPDDRDDNLAWRKWVGELAAHPLEREMLLKACERDFLFFVKGFLWIKQESPVVADLPFIPWQKQIDYMRACTRLRRAVEQDENGLTRGDLGSDKPRWHGWTWITLAEGLHIALFTKGATCLVGSRVEEDVDKRGSSKSLFWKLDYFLEHLPLWMVPTDYWNNKQGHPYPALRQRSKLKLEIPGRGTILGSATHENFGRSGRFAWIMLDEFAHVDRGQKGMGEKIWASTTSTCLLRRVLSTPNGRTNKFADLRFSDGAIEWFTTYWYDDPVKARGAYELTADMTIGSITLNIGDLWSPWCDEARKVLNNDNLFSQEVLLSYEGSGGAFYETVTPRIKLEQIVHPVWVGNLKIDEVNGRQTVVGLESDPQGFMTFWEMPTFQGKEFRFVQGDYVLGIDVARGGKTIEGKGASNSVIAVGRVDGETVVKVAQYMTSGLLAHLFSRIVCAVGWMGQSASRIPAYAIWEANGPGEYMGNWLINQHQYPRYFSEAKSGRSYASPGFWMMQTRRADGMLTGSRVNVFNEHLRWLQSDLYREPSFDTLREMEQYQSTGDGGCEHVAVKSALDPGLGRDNHGDSVIATVMMVWAARRVMLERNENRVEVVYPKGSLGYYQRQHQRELAGLWK